MNTIHQNAKDIRHKKTGLGVNAKKTKHMILSHQQYVGQNFRANEGGSNKRLKKMHNEYFHDLYSSANMLSDKIMAYELDRVCGMREKKNAHRLLVRKPKRVRSLENPGVDSRITLQLILQKQEGMAWIRFICLKIVKSGKPS
jgi:hypothetical protein